MVLQPPAARKIADRGWQQRDIVSGRFTYGDCPSHLGYVILTVVAANDAPTGQVGLNRQYQGGTT
jgi:hypothetical protein